jgi:filamentous hemagglutinin family protein
VLVASLFGACPGHAAVTTDGTLGARVRLAGRDVAIPARLGQVRGRNLFHSFRHFGIETGNKVTFTGPDGLANVIARVTGGEASRIDGTLASKVKGADLWVLNPAGILFGPHARLDVPGSFHASTADELRFEDGTVFSALDPDGSVLSVAAPEAFGFLDGRPAGITVDRSVLEVKEGKALSLVGDDLEIQGNSRGPSNNGFAGHAGTVQAAAGRVTLAALGGPGAVVPGTGEATGTVTGTIRLAANTAVAASGDGGGTIRIRGGRLLVEDMSSVLADNTGVSPAMGGVAIEADTIAIRNGGAIRSSARGRGAAGEVTVTAGRLGINAAGSEVFTGIATEVARGSTGDAGGVTITVDTIDIRGGGTISSFTFGSGNAGEVTVTATGHLEIDAATLRPFTGITSLADDGSTGDAGDLAVTADTLDIRSDGVIRSATRGKGDAGDVAVAAGQLRIDAAGSKIYTGIASRADEGSAGNTGYVAVTADTLDIRGRHSGVTNSTEGNGNANRVTITADTIDIRDNGLISSNTEGKGNAEKVTVNAGYLRIDGTGAEVFTGISSQALKNSTGHAGQVAVRADTIEFRGSDVTGGGLNSQTFGPGNAGTITVNADTIDIRDSGLISSGTRGGKGGEVTVNANHLRIDAAGPEGPSRIFTGINSRASSTATGDAGRVTVTADTIDIRGGAISSSTVGLGNAGEVTVTTTGRMTVTDEGTVETNSTQSGAAGNVAVHASRLEVRDGGEIGSSSTGTGRAGNVQLTTTGTLEVEDASIHTEGRSDRGGTIAVAASDLIHLQGAEVSSNGIRPEPGRSVITLQAPLIVLNGSRVTSLTEGEPLGGSGLARLLGDVTVISPDSFVAASSSVTLTGVEGDIGSRLAVPEGAFLNVGDLLRESCAARRTGTASSFTAMGRGGQPADPAGPLPARYRGPEDMEAGTSPGPAWAAAASCDALPPG